MLAHLSGTICLKHSATLILPPLSKPPSRRTCLIIISTLFFTALPIPSSDALWVCVCVCVVSDIVKRPVLPPCVVDGRSRNPLYYLLAGQGHSSSALLTQVWLTGAARAFLTALAFSIDFLSLTVFVWYETNVVIFTQLQNSLKINLRPFSVVQGVTTNKVLRWTTMRLHHKLQ